MKSQKKSILLTILFNLRVLDSKNERQEIEKKIFFVDFFVEYIDISYHQEKNRSSRLREDKVSQWASKRILPSGL